MKEYRYKESGIEWLGEVPAHWEIKRLGALGTFSKGGGISKSDLTDDGYDAILYGDLYTKYEVKTKDITNKIPKEITDDAKQLDYGDLLFTGSGEKVEEIGKCVAFQGNNETYAGGDLLIFKPLQHDSVFLSFLMNSETALFQKARAAKGDIIVHIYSKNLRNIYFPLPPPPEQKAIADYLDAACRKIDRVIEMKEEQIKKIDEYLLSKINEFITGKNLTNDTIKFSGTNLLGDFPDGWRVKRLKQITSKINSGVTPDGGAESYVSDGIPLIRSQNVTFQGLSLKDVAYITTEIHQNMSNSQVKNGDLLLNITGASMGRCYYVAEMDEVNVNQHVCIIRPRYQILTKYLYYFLMSNLGQAQIFSGYKGSGREGLNFQAIKNFRIPLPDIQTQKEIIEILDFLSAKVAKQKKLISSQIDTIKAYKKSLIHECVTGKKKVFDGTIEDASDAKVMA